VDEDAVFVIELRLSGKQRLRARVAGEQSLVWKQVGGAKKAGKSSKGGGPSAAAPAHWLAERPVLSGTQ
jgi:hypothetical protein